MENFEIPNGSKIKKQTSERGDVTLYWHKPDGGIFRYFIGLFFLTWMGGWFLGFKNVLGQLINRSDIPNSGFLMVWLVGWILGGCFAFKYIIQIFRPQRPEKVTFHADQLEYDTGTSSPVTAMFRGRFAYSPFEQWNRMFHKRKVFPSIQRGEIKFVHEKNPSRIYFDWESKRYEIGSGLSEPDIDWLYAQIANWSL